MSVVARRSRHVAASYRRDLAVSVLLGGMSLAVVMVVALEVDSAVRSLVVALFLLAVPGLTVVRLLGFRGPLFCAVVAVVVSVVVNLHLAVLHVAFGLWEPRWTVVFLALLTAALSGVPLVQSGEGR